MKLRVLGTGLSFPSPGGASSGYLVEGPATRLLIDCGHGVVGKLEEALDLRELSAIVISHMHPDHFLDLVPLKYAYFFQGIPKIPLLLPPGGVDHLRGLQPALRLSDAFFADTFELSEYDPESVLHAADFSIQLAAAQHYIPAYAMRVAGADGPGELFYSSDTGWTQPVVDLARGAAVGLVEATLLRYDADEDRPGHLSAALAGELARVAGVRRLLLTHYFSLVAEELRHEAEGTFGGPVELAREGATYTVE